MNLKGKMALGCMLLALVILWNYAPLVAADDEEGIVDARYHRYNIYIKFYDINNHGIQITKLTIQRGVNTLVWYTVFNNSPLIFHLVWVKMVYVWSNGKKSVSKYYWTNLYWNVPAYGTVSYNWAVYAPLDAPLGKGTFKWTWYGYQLGVPTTYMRSYAGILTIVVT
jgi:hypothetical protein